MPTDSPKSGQPHVLIAGGGGFLGSYALREFHKHGYRVSSVGIGGPHNHELAKNHAEGLISRDLLKSAADQFGAPDIIVHAAGGASVGQSWANPRGDFDLSVGSLVELLDFIRHDVTNARLCLVSSAAIYGEITDRPLKEDDASRPMSPYGTHKRICEELASAESRMTGLGVSIVRFFSLYGEGLRKQILWDILRRARAPDCKELELWGDGGETRDFLHVEDAARLLVLASENTEPGETQAYNGGSGRAVSIRDLASDLLCAAGLDPTMRFNGKSRSGDPRHLTADMSRAIAQLAFQPEIDLKRGLARYSRWFSDDAQKVES